MLQSHKRKLEKEGNKDFGWNNINSDMTFRHFEKNTLDVDKEAYLIEKQRKKFVNKDDLIANINTSVVDEERRNSVIKDEQNKRVKSLRWQRKRQDKDEDELDVDYINLSNKKFNAKLERAYG